jgi:hypothetical protein
MGGVRTITVTTIPPAGITGITVTGVTIVTGITTAGMTADTGITGETVHTGDGTGVNR